MVEAARAWRRPFVSAGLADEIWLLRGPETIAPAAFPALDAVPLAASRSRRLQGPC